MMLVDQFLPRPDIASTHQTTIAASPERVWEIYQEFGIEDLTLAKPLFWARGLLSRAIHGESNRDLPKFNNVLAEEAPHQVVMGVVGRWWTIGKEANRSDIKGPDAFLSFDEPGYGKATFSFQFVELPDGKTRLITETRVACTDPESRKAMKRYWRLIKLGSGLVRLAILHEFRKRASR